MNEVRILIPGGTIWHYVILRLLVSMDGVI